MAVEKKREELFSKFKECWLELKGKPLLPLHPNLPPLFRLSALPLTLSFKRLPEAAVLFLVNEVDGQLSVLLTQRSATVKTSPNEVCLPGGHLERGETATEAALRETEEEVGVPRGDVEIIGALPFQKVHSHGHDLLKEPLKNNGYERSLQFADGIRVTIILGILKSNDTYALKFDPKEVADAFWVPLHVFLDQNSHSVQKYSGLVIAREVSLFHCMSPEGKDHLVWGLTADMCIIASSMLLNTLPGFPICKLVVTEVLLLQDGLLCTPMQALFINLKSHL